MIGEESNPKHIWTSPLYFSMVWNGLFHRDQAINEYLLCSKSLGQSVQWPGFSSLLSVQALWEHEFALFLRPRLQISLLAKSWPDCPNLSNKGSYVRFCIAFCNGVTQIWFKSSAQVPFLALLGQVFLTSSWNTMFLVEFYENSHSKRSTSNQIWFKSSAQMPFWALLCQIIANPTRRLDFEFNLKKS